jgi:hypothetical protein
VGLFELVLLKGGSLGLRAGVARWLQADRSLMLCILDADARLDVATQAL